MVNSIPFISNYWHSHYPRRVNNYPSDCYCSIMLNEIILVIALIDFQYILIRWRRRKHQVNQKMLRKRWPKPERRKFIPCQARNLMFLKRFCICSFFFCCYGVLFFEEILTCFCVSLPHLLPLVYSENHWEYFMNHYPSRYLQAKWLNFGEFFWSIWDLLLSKFLELT